MKLDLREQAGRVGEALRSVWVPILQYHRIVPRLPSPERDPFHIVDSVETFEGHLKWLARFGYRSLPLSEVASRLERGRQRLVPERVVAITFDDGYEDNYVYAWPLLRRYGFTATIFLVADAIGEDNSFDFGYTDIDPEPATMLRLEQIREMQALGIDFGSHTRSHPDALTELDDSALRYELESSRAVLEDMLDAPVPHFAYPHNVVDARVEAAVERAGYRLGCAGWGETFSQYCAARLVPPFRHDVGLMLQIWKRQVRRVAKLCVPSS